MEILFALIPLALILSGTMAVLFYRAVSAGQFDDLKTPAHRMLLDNTEEPDV